MTIRHIIEFFNAPSEPSRADCAFTIALAKILQRQNIMSDQLQTLLAKLDEAKEAAVAERVETLASLEQIKSLIKAKDLSGAILKAEELTASIKGIHEAADDEVTPEEPA